MSSRRKERIVYAGLLLLTLWPAVHIYLAKRFDLSPWKLAGWGMYAAPRFGLFGMEVYGRRPGSEQLEQLTAPPPDLSAAANDFLERYRWLRELTRPDSFAHSVLQLHPEWEELRIVVFQPVLDKRTGMVAMESRAYEYPADS